MTKRVAAIELPWFDTDLSPNKARNMHWSKKAKAVKAARSLAAWWAVQTRQFEFFKDKRLSVRAIFTPPDNRRRDTDNMIGSCKAYFDGLSDVIGDDSKWLLSFRREEPHAPGGVRIEVEVVE